MVLLVATTPFGALSPTTATAQQPTASGTPVDRWLVSSPFSTEGGGGDSPLTGPGEEGVLPDRGRELAGATWTLVRRDGSPELPLDSVISDRDSPVFVYAHSYLRLQQDRTMTLALGGLGNARVRAWVNGRLLRTRDGEPLEVTAPVTIPVRLGSGWNTLLVRAEGGEEGFGITAELGAAGGGAPVRVQASRPPGDVRTGPDPWVLAGTGIERSGGVAWQRDELLGELMLEVTAWSRTPVDTVRVRLRGDGIDAHGGARWLTPAAPVPVALWVPLDRLHRLDAARPFDVELKWADEESRQQLPGPDASPVDPSADRILLAGWEVRSTPDGSEARQVGPAGPLPSAAGWTLSGEWKVPEQLAGRDLYLRAADAPGQYRIGDRAFGDDETVPVCVACRKGQKVEILVRSRGPWTGVPRIVGEPGAEGGT